MTKVSFLDPRTVHLLHASAIELFGGSPGIRDHGLLDSALARAENRLAYGESDLHALAAAYDFGIAKNHAFHDGNKRTAWATAVAFLMRNGVEICATVEEAAQAVIDLAAGTLSEEEFAAWLRRITRSGADPTPAPVS